MKSWKQEIILKFLGDRLVFTGFVVIALAVVLAVFPNLVAEQNPYDLATIELADSYRPPGEVFPLGTDDQGRDILSAILYGLRISLLVGFGSTFLSAVIGFAIGLVAGYTGGIVDKLIMRIVDVQLSLPDFLVALVIMAFWGQGVGKIIIAITVVSWVYYARIVRGMVLAEKEKDYVQAAIAGGQSRSMIMYSEIAPNIMAHAIVIATVRVAYAILLEATLSFLGLGVPVTRPSLGMLIANGYEVLFSGYWWMSVFPGVALIILVLAINIVGDSLRDLLDPRLRQ